MIGVIGIGTLSSEIALRLKEYSTNIISYVYNDHNLNIKGTMEDFEKNFNEIPNVEQINEVYCLVEGTENVAGITLKLLSFFKEKPITIFYLTKNHSVMNKQEKLNNKISINVLQEYARSGMFEHMFIIDHNIIWEGIIDNAELAENKSLLELRIMLFDKICFAIYAYHQIRHEKPIDGLLINFEDTIYRISTFFEISQNDKIALYYPLKYTKVYSYILNLPIKLSKDDLQMIKNLKSKTKEGSEDYEVYVSMFSDEKRSLIGFCSTNIVQESDYIN